MQGERANLAICGTLLRDYILILANTGMRHGTEAENLCWKHISLFEDKGLKYLEMSVTGKTGRRDIICRAGEPPHLNWSSAMFRKRRTDNDEQTTEAGRDYHEVEAS